MYVGYVLGDISNYKYLIIILIYMFVFMVIRGGEINGVR